MIPPNKLDYAPFEVVKLISEVQEWTISEISRRLAKTGKITSTSEYQLIRLNEMRLFDENLKEKIVKATEMTDKEIDTLFQEAAKSSYIYDKRLFEAKGIPFISFEKNAFMQNLTVNIIKQTQGTMYNITHSMGFAEIINNKVQFKPIAQFYQDTLDFAVMQISTGVIDYNTAIKNAVVKMTNSGLRTVDYASGRSNRIDVAARRAIMGGLKDLSRTQSEHNSELLGLTTLEISYHSGHRPSHGWGGRRFDIEGKYGYPKEEELYAKYGGGSLNDYGCRHDKYPVLPESPPAYTDKQLEELEEKEQKTKIYQGIKYTAYEAQQQKRKIERSMRASRLKAHGFREAGLKDEYQTVKEKYLRQRNIYENFNEKMGLTNDYNRVYLDGLGKI